MKKLLVIGLLLAGCNNNVIQTPVRVFDRPSDVALTCVRGEGPPDDPIPLDTNKAVYVTHPLSFCAPEVIDQNTNNVYDSNGVLLISYLPLLRAVVANSARGELALVHVATGQIVDLNPRVPGYGFLPVGRLPEHVRVSDNGCQAVTANVDSCDFGIVDMERLHNAPRVNTLRDAGVPITDPAVYDADLVRRAQPAVKDAGGVFHPVNVRPSWIEYATDSEDGTVDVSSGSCKPGKQKAWVALPGCQLVAKVSLVPQGVTSAAPGGGTEIHYFAEILQAVRVTRDTATVLTAADLATLSCPSECSGEAGSGNLGPADLGGAPSDGGADGGSSLPATQGLPTTLAVDKENGVGRLFVGDLAGETLWIVPVSATGGDALGTPRSVTLEKGARGVQVVRVSPRSQAGKFLYAVARDGTVRVVDLDREAECETNPDPRSPLLLSAPTDSTGPIDPALDARSLGCFPLGDPSTPPRNPTMASPGITLQAGALARDVAFVHLDVPPPPTNTTLAPPNAGPNLVVGDFAWIIGSEGRASLVNIFDACPAPNIELNPSGPFTPACQLGNVAASIASASGFAGHPQPTRLDRMAHRLRQGDNRLGAAPVNCTDNGGAPRIPDESIGNAFTVTVNGTAAGGSTDGGVISQPSLLQQDRPLGPGVNSQCASSTKRSIAVYDPDHLRNENWEVVWEGVIPGTTRSTMTPGQMSGNGVDVFVDPGGAWCTRGLKAGDKLVLTGCNTDADCDYVQTCVRDPAQPPDVPNGLCLDRQAPDNRSPVNQAQADACSLLLRSLKRYRVLHAYQAAPLPVTHEVSDWLRVAEIYEPEHPEQTHTCDPAAAADPCADVKLSGPKDTAGNHVSLATRCLPDSDGQHRCLRACDPKGADLAASGCGLDYLCIGPDHSSIPSGETGRCMRSPLDEGMFATCLKELQPYETRVGESFLVTGSASGFLTDLEPDPVTRECVTPPVSSPYVRLHQGRIPIGAPDLKWCPPPNDPLHLHDPYAGDAYDSLGPLDGSLPNVCLDPGTTAMLTACTPGAGTGCGMGEQCLARAGGPGGFCVDRTKTRAVHFENIYWAIELNVPSRSSKELASGASDIVPADATDLKFSVVGGGFPLAAALGVDAQAQQPRVIVAAPDRQTVFVVDEGKQTAATGLRGQLLRVSTAVQSTDRSFVVR